MLVTLLPIVTDVRPVQPEKAPSSIDVTLLGITTDVRPEHLQKALSPIDITLVGIVNEVRPEHLKKALPPMDVTLLGITVFMQPVISVLVAVFIKALQLSRESYTVFPLSTDMDVRPVH